MEITQRVRVDDPETGASVVLMPGKVDKKYEKLIENPTVVKGYKPEPEQGDRVGPAADEVRVSEDLVEFGYVDETSGEFVPVAEAPQTFEILDRPEPVDQAVADEQLAIFDRPDGEIAEISAHGDEDHPLHGLRLKDDFITFASLNDIDLGDADTVPKIKARIEAVTEERVQAASTGSEVVHDHPEPAEGAEPETPAAGEQLEGSAADEG